MSKRRIIFNEKVYQRWLREGRGMGEGPFYKPWLTVHDFASQGRCHRIPNWKHGRLHHLMSDLEEIIFYLFSWSHFVVDIREQFPLLPLDETIEIAKQAGLDHQVEMKSKFPIVNTTDFLLKIEDVNGEKFIARTVKPIAQLKDMRVLEKFEIERRYWAARNIDWGIITDENLPISLFQNIKLVYGYYNHKTIKELRTDVYHQSVETLTDLVLKNIFTLREITQQVDKKFNFAKSTAMTIVWHLVARRWWQTDMSKDIDMSKILVLENCFIPYGFEVRREA